MNRIFVSHLESVEQRLHTYLDAKQELRRDTAWRLEICACALLDGSISPEILADDWPDWFPLVSAFVAAYSPAVLSVFEARTTLLTNRERPKPGLLTQDDRIFLELLRGYLKHYQEMRDAGSNVGP